MATTTLIPKTDTDTTKKENFWSVFLLKRPYAGKDWGQEEDTTEDEMVGWHHWLNGHEFGWTPGVGDGQAGLVCCSSWGHKESKTTEQLNWTDSSGTQIRKSLTRLAIWSQQYFKRIMHHDYIRFIPGMQTIEHHIYKMKGKKYDHLNRCRKKYLTKFYILS